MDVRCFQERVRIVSVYIAAVQPQVIAQVVFGEKVMDLLIGIFRFQVRNGVEDSGAAAPIIRYEFEGLVIGHQGTQIGCES